MAVEKSFDEVFQEYQEQNKMWHFEGPKGVRNLTEIVEVLGYTGEYGQPSIERFLEDNPGAIRAIADWISEQNIPEWTERLWDMCDKELEEDEDDDR